MALHAVRHRDRELAACPKLGDQLVESAECRAARGVEREVGLDAIVPLAVREESLLRREAQVPLLPNAVAKDAQLLEQFADERRLDARHGHVVRRPGIG
jgi:hypothetical protein